MKKSTGIALIIAAVCLVAGIAALGVFLGINRGFSFGDSIEKTVVSSYEIATEELSGDFDSISIIESEANIELIPAAGSTGRVEYSIVEDRDYIITVEDGVLDIRVDDRRSPFNGFNIVYKEMILSVYLPESEYERLFIDSSSGCVDVPVGFTFGDAQIECTSGSICFEAQTAGIANFKSTSGSVELANLSPEKLIAESTSGGIELADVISNEAQINGTSGSIEIDGGRFGSLAAGSTSGRVDISGIEADSISAASSSGEVIVEDCTASSETDIKASSGRIHVLDCTLGVLSAENSSGSITLESTAVAGLARLKNSSGGVKFVDADAGELDVETTSGSVKGSLLTGKMFDVRTTSGGENVPESDRDGGLCTINTTSGSVKITVGE